jgi:hypothetical protein
LERFRKDLNDELAEVRASDEPGAERAGDLLSDITVAFDRAASFAEGQSHQAAARLAHVEEPVRFTRPRKLRDTPHSGENENALPLWQGFDSESESGEAARAETGRVEGQVPPSPQPPLGRP